MSKPPLPPHDQRSKDFIKKLFEKQKKEQNIKFKEIDFKFNKIDTNFSKIEQKLDSILKSLKPKPKQIRKSRFFEVNNNSN